MKRTKLKRGAPLPRGSGPKRCSRISRGTKLRPVGKRGRAIRRELANLRLSVLERDHHICQRCEDLFCRPLDLHHRRARSQGGTHSLANLVTLGRPCHEAVTNLSAKDWRKWVITRKHTSSEFRKD